MDTISELKHELSALLDGFQNDKNVTQRRKRYAELRRVTQRAWGVAMRQHPVAYLSKTKRTPLEVVQDLVANHGWCRLFDNSRDMIVKGRLVDLNKKSVFVEKTRRGSRTLFAAPTHLAWIALREPERLKEAANLRGNKRKALMFEIEAKYGSWNHA